MNGYGIEAARPPASEPAQPPARWLVLIDSGGTRIARLFLADHKPVAEFNAASEEVALMTGNLQAVRGATGSEWDDALAGSSRDERAAAEVFEIKP